MYRYAQINDDGTVVSDSRLYGKINAKNMIPIPEEFDLNNRKYKIEAEEWEEYENPTQNAPSEEDVFRAEVLLNQVEITATQQQQDRVLAEILLNGLGV